MPPFVGILSSKIRNYVVPPFSSYQAIPQVELSKSMCAVESHAEIHGTL